MILRVPKLLLVALVAAFATAAFAQTPEVLYYKFNEGTGTVTANSASPGQGSATANLNTSDTFAAGQIGSALSAPGAATSTNAISTGWIPNWPSATPQSWTIEFWINGSTNTTNLWYIFGCASASSWRCFTNGVAGAGNLRMRGPITDLAVNGCWDGTWHHVAFVYDSVAGQTRSYLDGTLQNTVTQAAPNIVGSADFLVGGYGTNAGLNGLMDDFRVWAVARTGAEIAASMAAESPAAEIDVLRSAASIADGEPNHALGNVSTLTGQTFTFTVANAGPGALQLPGTTPVTISGITGGATVTVSAQPAGSVAAAGSTTFDVLVQPIAGAFTFTVNVVNTDSNESPYDFVCQGTGFTNAPPVLALATSTDFVAGSDFDLSVAPAGSLAGTNGAVLTVTDATPDPVDATITFTTGPQGATPPTGIAAPANVTAGAGAGFNLTWTGTADATNTPGTYVWDVQLADGVSTVNYAVRIIITNAAPAHVVIAPTTGDGSVGTPYTRSIDIGSTTAVNIATVSDANTGQNLNFVSQSLTASPGGSSATHTFSLSPVAGNPATLVCTPSAAVLADLGDFDYTIVVEDNTSGTPVQTTLYVTITIVGTAPTITSTALTTAAVGFLYSYQLTATGNPATFTFGASPLPAWLSINGTGLISGTPTVGDIGVTPSITATAANGVAPDASQIFTITVAAAVAPLITSTAVTTATVGTLYTYTFTLTGNPTPTLSLTAGTLPAWLTLTGNTLSGTPPTGSAGTYGPFTFTATNGVAPDATQSFSIVVSNASSGGGGGGGDDDSGCSTGESNSLWMLAGVLASFALALRLRRKTA
jgi:hypothetical protein